MQWTESPAVRAILAALLLVALAIPHWNVVIDDLFITIGFAFRWWDTGVLSWTTGEVVEGYSNFTWLLWMTLGAALNLDTLLIAKLASLASGCAFLAVLSYAAPRDWRGHLLVLAFATWTPLAFWGAAGMEATTFALLLATGWAAAMLHRPWARGAAAVLLGLAALTHPEGHLHLLLALAFAAWRRPAIERADAAVGAVAVVLAAYHAWRIAHFGHVMPAPYLTKISAVWAFDVGLPQLGRELGSAVGIFAALAVIVRPKRRDLAPLVLPLAVQCALLVRANGDWMAWGRFLLPGVCATALVGLVLQPARPAPDWRVGLPLLALVLGAALVEVPRGELQFRDLGAVLHPAAHIEAGFEATLQQDVEYVIVHVPVGDTILVRDVGIVGNIPGVRVRDSVGLVDRDIAEFRASGAAYDPARALKEYGPDAGQIAFVRVANDLGSDLPELPDWFASRFVGTEDLYAGDFHVRWYRAHDRRPSQQDQLARWRELNRRFPRVAWLRWRWMVAEADAGAAPTEMPEAGGYVGLAAMPESLSFTQGTVALEWVEGRGFPLYSNGTLVSRPLGDTEMQHAELVLDCDDPGSDGATVEVRIGACGATIVVRERKHIALADLCPPAGPDRVSVSFTNDISDGTGDRNAFAYLQVAPAPL